MDGFRTEFTANRAGKAALRRFLLALAREQQEAEPSERRDETPWSS
jgi:hypothetical protein